MKKQFRVVDIPAGATAEQAEQLLNEPCAAGYYLRSINMWPDKSARAVFNLRAKPEKED